jgi:hypothetical protein
VSALSLATGDVSAVRLTTAGVIAARLTTGSGKGTHDDTVLYLLAAVIIAAMAFGYLIWRDQRGPRSHDRAHGGAYHGSNNEGDLS